MSLANFLTIDLLGYVAGTFLLLMASMKTQLAMRLCNMAGNICFIAYGFMAGLMPVFILNTIIMGLHFWRIMQERKTLKAGDAVSETETPEPAAEPPTHISYQGIAYQRIDAA